MYDGLHFSRDQVYKLASEINRYTRETLLVVGFYLFLIFYALVRLTLLDGQPIINKIIHSPAFLLGSTRCSKNVITTVILLFFYRTTISSDCHDQRHDLPFSVLELNHSKWEMITKTRSSMIISSDYLARMTLCIRTISFIICPNELILQAPSPFFFVKQSVFSTVHKDIELINMCASVISQSIRGP